MEVDALRFVSGVYPTSKNPAPAERRPLLQVTAQRTPGDHRVGGGAAAEDAKAGQADVGVAAPVGFRAVVQVVLAL